MFSALDMANASHPNESRPSLGRLARARVVSVAGFLSLAGALLLPALGTDCSIVIFHDLDGLQPSSAPPEDSGLPHDAWPASDQAAPDAHTGAGGNGTPDAAIPHSDSADGSRADDAQPDSAPVDGGPADQALPDSAPVDGALPEGALVDGTGSPAPLFDGPVPDVAWLDDDASDGALLFGDARPEGAATWQCGDVDGDGRVTQFDVALIEGAGEGGTLNADKLQRADVNRDGWVTRHDAFLIQAVLEAAPEVVLCATWLVGDLNGDGVLTKVEDAEALAAQAANKVRPPGTAGILSDVNCDGSLDILDSLLIAQAEPQGRITDFHTIQTRCYPIPVPP